ncbi:hypothetical protein [Solibacillus sp. CAU 1738]|uniref:hypothetical protein n=1 Tax=Solibacillus sp. CAU 1738 TaxID=3140363 RepID=UPI003260D460
MSKLFTYVPLVCFLIVLYVLDSIMLKGILLGIIAPLLFLAKYKRVQMQKEEIEFDDRVNANISKWSLRSLFGLNAVMLLLIATNQQGMFDFNINQEMVLLYLVLTLFIPFYVVPAIVKQY